MSEGGSHRDFDTILEELHQAVVSEKVAASLVDTGHPEDTDVSLKLEEAAECLRLIERVRKRQTQPADLPETETPKKIGRFEIEEQIGEGSYGFVYRAHDPDLNRKVAIKVPRPEVALSPGLRDRFVREAEVSASLQHPAIVRVLQAGRSGGTQFISSELCSGPTLAEWLKVHAGPMDADHAARLMLVVTKAVQHAHSRGVLHRDLKPGNIMLNRSGAAEDKVSSDQLAEIVQITDFGLALALNSNTRDTQTGAIVGTPAYMSPEQADGRVEEVSSASDVYSLGAILYELLTGSPPFQAESVLATLEAVRSAQPARPSKHVASVPPDVESICLKCLEKDPARRYASAAALADDLQGFLERRPISARPLGTTERLWRWTKRNPLPAALSVGLITSIVAGATLFGLQFVETKTANSKLTKSNNDLRVAKDKAEEAASLEALVTEFMNRTFRQTSPIAGGSRDLKVVDVLARTRQELDDETDMGPISRGAIYVAIAKAYWGLGEYSHARETAQQAIDVLPPEHEKRLQARWVVGEAYNDDGSPLEAARVLEPLLSDIRKILGPEHMLALQCAGTLADVYTSQQRFADADRLMQSMPDDAEVPPVLQIANYVSQARILTATGKREEAIDLLIETLAAARALEKGRDHELARVLNALGVAYLKQGNGDEAKKYLTENLEIREQLFGTEHHETLLALSNLAGAYYLCREMEAAGDYLNRALGVSELVMGDQHPDTMGMRYNLGVFKMKSGHAADAVPLFRDVYEWRKGRPDLPASAVRKAGERLAAALEAAGDASSAADVRSELDEQ